MSDKRRSEGWFSRRHKTGEPHSAVRAQLQARKQLQKEAAEYRLAVALKRLPQEQLKRLDQRLGKGKGAKKERERLQAEIAAAYATKAVAASEEDPGIDAELLNI